MPSLESMLDEHEHQALDLLDEAGQDAVSEANVELVRGLLTRLVTSVAEGLIDAARELSRTQDRGTLETGTLDEIRLTLAERPQLSLAIAPAVETTGVLLGLDRDAGAWAVLLELAKQAELAEQAEIGGPLHTCSIAITERLQAAHPTASEASKAPISRPLRVFRSAAVAKAGPSLRARMLAADQPEHLALASRLVEHHVDAAALVAAFDQARAALEQPKSTADGPPQIDGPKRKFTYVHVILALIVLGLTLWHYVWR